MTFHGWLGLNAYAVSTVSGRELRLQNVMGDKMDVKPEDDLELHHDVRAMFAQGFAKTEDMTEERGFLFCVPGAPPSHVDGLYCPGCSLCQIFESMRSCYSWYLIQTRFWELMNVDDDEVRVWRERSL